MIKLLYKLKQVTISVVEVTKYSYPNNSYKLAMDTIKVYKEKMEKYERGSPDWKFYQQDIQSVKSGCQFYNGNGKRKKNRRFDVTITVNNWTKATRTFPLELRNSENMMQELRAWVKKYKRDTIQLSRLQIKLGATPSPFFTEIMMFYGPKKNRVFSEAGQVLKCYIKKHMKVLFEDKKPKTKSNYLGIEIEFCAPITEENLAMKMFRRNMHNFTQLKHDGSLRPHKDKGEFGFEFAILLREGFYKKDLKSITDLLTEIKATATDRRCGLHVHFDMRKRDKNIVYNNLVASQTALLSIVDPRRYDSEFCRVVRSKDFPISFNGEREERYKTINAAAYFRHQTLEVRMHEGTVDFKTISNWIDVLVKIVNYKTKVKKDIAKLPMLKTKFKIAPKVYKEILDKSCYWQVNYSADAREMQRGQNDGARRGLNTPFAERLRQMEQATETVNNNIAGPPELEVPRRGARNIPMVDGVVAGNFLIDETVPNNWVVPPQADMVVAVPGNQAILPNGIAIPEFIRAEDGNFRIRDRAAEADENQVDNNIEDDIIE